MQQLGFKLLNDISWVKPNPPPNLSCRYFTHATETIIWAAKNKKSRHTFNYKLMRETNRRQANEIRLGKSSRQAAKKSASASTPAQKPVALLERILLASSNEGDFVLDPFMGSGTTLVSALRLRRHAYGCEFELQSVSSPSAVSVPIWYKSRFLSPACTSLLIFPRDPWIDPLATQIAPQECQHT